MTHTYKSICAWTSIYGVVFILHLNLDLLYCNAQQFIFGWIRKNWVKDFCCTWIFMYIHSPRGFDKITWFYGWKLWLRHGLIYRSIRLTWADHGLRPLPWSIEMIKFRVLTVSAKYISNTTPFVVNHDRQAVLSSLQSDAVLMISSIIGTSAMTTIPVSW